MPTDQPATAYPIETLVLQDFTRTANSQTGVYETIMEHEVPRNEVRALLRYPGRLTLGKQQILTGDGMLTDFDTTSRVVFSRNFPTPAILLVYDADTVDADGNPTGTLADTLDYVDSAPGAGEFTVSAGTGTGGTDEIVLGAAADIAMGEFGFVYHAFLDGEFTIEVFSPNERRHDTYANGTIRRLNSAPQDDVNSVFAIGSNTPWLPQDTLIRVQVKVDDADSIVSFATENPYTNIELPFTRQAIAAVKDPDAQLAGLGA